eukprot:3163789-Heterocapsa_arctica.AAC.1
MEITESDIILKVAAPVVGALGRRRRQVCWDLKVLSLMSGFWTKHVVQMDMPSINHFPAEAKRRVRSRYCSRSSRGSRCPAATARVQWLCHATCADPSRESTLPG